MKHIKTLNTRNLCESAQSACKTSCGIANQQCENKKQESAK